MTQLTPLDSDQVLKAIDDFDTSFGKYPKAFKAGYLSAAKPKSRGKAVATSQPPEDEFVYYARTQLGIAKLTWLPEEVKNGEVRMEGSVTNVSTLRPRSYCVGFVTNQKKTAVWFVDHVDPQKTVPLKVQNATVPPDAPADEPKQKSSPKVAKFDHWVGSVWLQSVPSDSPEAEEWRLGKHPTGPAKKK